jgi:hypothetical protein
LSFALSTFPAAFLGNASTMCTAVGVACGLRLPALQETSSRALTLWPGRRTTNATPAHGQRRVGRRHDGGLGDRVVPYQDALHLGGVDAFPFGHKGMGQAVHDGEVALVVGAGGVAGVQPPAGQRLVGPAHCLRGRSAA